MPEHKNEEDDIVDLSEVDLFEIGSSYENVVSAYEKYGDDLNYCTNYDEILGDDVGLLLNVNLEDDLEYRKIVLYMKEQGYNFGGVLYQELHSLRKGTCDFLEELENNKDRFDFLRECGAVFELKEWEFQMSSKRNKVGTLPDWLLAYETN